MGNTPSNLSNNEPEDNWWTKDEIKEEIQNPDVITKEQTFQSFSEEFNRKRDTRKQILEQKRKEIQGIREELSILRKENETLRNTQNQQDKNTQQNEQLEFLRRQNLSLQDEIEAMRKREENVQEIMEKNKQLRISVSEMQSELQKMNSSLLDFEQQKEDYKRHVIALKDVIKVSKELLQIRENELQQLKEKLKSIEVAFNEREASLMSNDLKKEYEKQLQNIRNLRELYEERSRTHRREAALLKSNLEEKDKELEKGVEKLREVENRVTDLEKENSDKYDTIKSLESNLGLVKAEARQYQAELAVINQLFSHILLAFNNSPDLDFDKLLKRLEENHDLLKDIVNNEVSSEVSSALPKVLLDLVNQISCEKEALENCDNDKKKVLVANSSEPTSSTYNLNSPAEIAENLPKVWRVLIELLSHQSANFPDQATASDEDDENRCFKTVTTAKGPSLVLSVSKTFFRLKELIIEKKTLEKDMNNLKQLNSHLECRLQEQEKRFEFVSTELSKTWSFVSKLQKEHKLLHTQEQILRYELAQKRKLLNELKEELEYSREKWQEAREKNSKTEKEWLVLRKEFAARRRTIVEDGSNSVESGYSDEREGLSDEEPGYETDISECNAKADETCEDDNEVQKKSKPDNNHGSSLTIDFKNGENEMAEETDSNSSVSSIRKEEITDIQSENEIDDSVQQESKPANNDETIDFKNKENEMAEETDSNSSASSIRKEEITDIQSENKIDDSEEKGNGHSEIDECSTSQENKNEAKDEAQNTTTDERPLNITTHERDYSHCGSTSTQSLEERLAARDERLKRLEGQCRALVSQVTNTSNKSKAICNKLEDLHEIYGETSKDSSSKKATKEKKENEIDTDEEESEES